MEELTGLFAGSQVTVQHNSIAAEHPHFSLYKLKTSSSNQEARRKKFLELQKLKRYDYANHARALATNEWSGEFKEENDAEIEDDECYVPPPRSYKNQLMHSEWLVEIPSDLEEQWWLMLCPVGKRCLVVSSRCSTKVYTKSGYRLLTFPSLLPGGSKCATGNPMHAYSLLDCIYNELERSFYILDVMCWNSHPCFDSETEFRFYWAQSKIAEVPEVKESSKGNPYKFLPLPYFECTPDAIKNSLWSPLPFSPKLDGLLFYHKRTHYIAGSTPLVGWLKGYMVPEMFNIPVPPSLLEEKPPEYTRMQEFCPQTFAKHARRKEHDEHNMQYEDDEK